MYAHTLSGHTEREWEPLGHHLDAVAAGARERAVAFDAGAWGDLLGQCHDLGKGSAEFQRYLQQSHTAQNADADNAGEETLRKQGRVDHSTFGARYVHDGLGFPYGAVLAFCIAGHHAGLPDWSPADDGDGRFLQARLDPLQQRIPEMAEPALNLSTPGLPSFLTTGRLIRQHIPFTMAFFTRILFSTLIDADRTCTEAFTDPVAAKERALSRPGIADLKDAVYHHVQDLQKVADLTPVNEQRRQVQQQCLTAAQQQPGFFSLQVPTGGGKTLASLLFALEHAVHWSKRRVVVAIPFTSIIEQTADVYRRALGELAEYALVEHHTNVVPEEETRANKLGAENWEAPLVVTTNVQLFESLFAARTTPCRKLHNLANSVIVLDEAQTLPVELLEPTLAALRELVQHYGCSVVLCTATQPALERRADFTIGLDGVRPIIAGPVPLFEALRRVEVRHAGALSDAALTARLAAEPRVLCIVNTRPHALALYVALSQQSPAEEDCFHLSTLMCGAHRRAALRAIRERMARNDGAPCRVVSTQLVEAGVDLDFPTVYRAAAGIDSIAQAAGRCNREGRLHRLGVTHVFEPENGTPPGFLRNAWQAGSEVSSLPVYRDDLLAPAAVRHYFQLLFWRHRDLWDRRKVMECFDIDWNRKHLRFQFRQGEERYRMIEDTQVPILVPFGKDSMNYLDQLQNRHVEFVSQRKLQPYLVSVPRHAHDRMVQDHAVEAHPSGVSLLLRPALYSSRTGLQIEGYGLDTLIA